MKVYYEIYFWNNRWEIWEWTYDGHAKLFKTYKTKDGVKHWADKQWARVIWR